MPDTLELLGGIATHPDRAPLWDWAKWFPHVRAPRGPRVLTDETEIGEWALGVLARLRDWPVADKAALKSGESYSAALRLRLDLTQLPKPLQVDAIGSKDWNVKAEIRRTRGVRSLQAWKWLWCSVTRSLPSSVSRLSLLPIGIAIGVALWLFLNRTRVGMMIRAGVDDRAMLAAAGVDVNRVFATTFAIGAGLAGLGGVIGAVELSMVPGEDTRLLLASLVVVIVGGMGSVVGAAMGAAILGLAETYGLAYAPTYSVVFTFVILVLVLAFRPRGILGRPA